jgi:hypothetical protein
MATTDPRPGALLWPGEGAFGVEVASGGAIWADLRHAHDDLGALLDGLDCCIALVQWMLSLATAALMNSGEYAATVSGFLSGVT